MMNLLRLFGSRTASAPVARERLQILLAHERGLRGQPDLLGLLRAEILAVVSRHVVLDPEKVIVRMDRGNHVSTLEVDIEVPMIADSNNASPGLRVQIDKNRHAVKALEIAPRTHLKRRIAGSRWKLRSSARQSPIAERRARPDRCRIAFFLER